MPMRRDSRVVSAAVAVLCGVIKSLTLALDDIHIIIVTTTI